MNTLRYGLWEQVDSNQEPVLLAGVSGDSRDFFRNGTASFLEVFALPGDHGVAERFVSAQIALDPGGNFHTWLTGKMKQAFSSGQRSAFGAKVPVFELSDDFTCHIVALIIWLDRVDTEKRFERWAVALFTETFNRGKAHSLALR